MANGLNNNQDLLRSLDDLQRTFGAPIPEVDFIQPPVEAAPVNQNQNILMQGLEALAGGAGGVLGNLGRITGVLPTRGQQQREQQRQNIDAFIAQELTPDQQIIFNALSPEMQQQYVTTKLTGAPQENLGTQNAMFEKWKDMPEGELKDLYGSLVFGGSGDTADIQNYKFFKELPEDEQEDYLTLRRLNPQAAYLMALSTTAAKQGLPYGTLPLTPGQEKIDTTFGAGAQQMQQDLLLNESNLSLLTNAVDELENAEKNNMNFSGIDVGIIGQTGLLPILNPAAVDMQERIAGFVYQSLKATLGAQFTEGESKAYVSVTFNPFLDEKVNARRLKRAIDLQKGYARDSQQKLDYFAQNQTLRGYQGTEITKESVFDDLNNKVIGDFINSDYQGLSGDQLNKARAYDYGNTLIDLTKEDLRKIYDNPETPDWKIEVISEYVENNREKFSN